MCYTGKTEPRHNRAESVIDNVDEFIFDSKEQHLCTQFLKMQNSQEVDLKEHPERYRNVMPVFGFNNAKYDINLVKSNLKPILVTECDIELKLGKNAQLIVSSNFGDSQLLDIKYFLAGDHH